jgi:hypothetical protein
MDRLKFMGIRWGMYDETNFQAGHCLFCLYPGYGFILLVRLSGTDRFWEHQSKYRIL